MEMEKAGKPAWGMGIRRTLERVETGEDPELKSFRIKVAAEIPIWSEPRRVL